MLIDGTYIPAPIRPPRWRFAILLLAGVVFGGPAVLGLCVLVWELSAPLPAPDLP